MNWTCWFPYKKFPFNIDHVLTGGRPDDLQVKLLNRSWMLSGDSIGDLRSFQLNAPSFVYKNEGQARRMINV